MFENPIGEAGKQEILQQMFRKFLISNLQAQYSRKLCTFHVAEQSHLSRKISLAITRKITQE